MKRHAPSYIFALLTVSAAAAEIDWQDAASIFARTPSGSGDDPTELHFTGEVTVSGRVVLDLERQVAFFYPTETDLRRFPSVESRPATEIELGADFGSILESVLGSERASEESASHNGAYETQAVVTLRNLETAIECDRRVYWSQVVKLAPTPGAVVARSGVVAHAS